MSPKLTSFILGILIGSSPMFVNARDADNPTHSTSKGATPLGVEEKSQVVPPILLNFNYIQTEDEPIFERAFIELLSRLSNNQPGSWTQVIHPLPHIEGLPDKWFMKEVSVPTRFLLEGETDKCLCLGQNNGPLVALSGSRVLMKESSGELPETLQSAPELVSFIGQFATRRHDSDNSLCFHTTRYGPYLLIENALFDDPSERYRVRNLFLLISSKEKMLDFSPENVKVTDRKRPRESEEE